MTRKADMKMGDRGFVKKYEDQIDNDPLWSELRKIVPSLPPRPEDASAEFLAGVFMAERKSSGISTRILRNLNVEALAPFSSLFEVEPETGRVETAQDRRMWEYFNAKE
jgi:hypothetical protein